jgi:hypothetical protein
VNKGRQLGFSTAIAIEATHASCTRRNYNSNIVSTTQDEAQDKLRIGDMLYSSIDPEYERFKPIKYRNAEDALAFHMPPYTSTIISKPGTSAIRGGKKDMYYDEAAFIKEFAKLWQAGLPAITRGDGRVTVVSTPMGQSGLYYDLWNEKMFSHHVIPWWESRFMVRGGDGDDPYGAVAEAMAGAPEMHTIDRVEAFGSEKIKQIFTVGLRGDLIVFQTEYECMFVDEAEAYFPYDLVMSGVEPTLKLWKDFPEGWEPAGDVSIGVDLAKERDSTVFTVVEHLKILEQPVVVVRYVEATQSLYERQFQRLKRLVEITHARRVSIDATGPGQMFAEKAKQEGLGRNVVVEGINFTNAKKEKWATTFKGDLQLERVKYPRHPVLIDQIHSIKRTRTENNFFKFSGPKDDYFWSLMLAMYGEGYQPVRFYRL